jgi:hypothetical protein
MRTKLKNKIYGITLMQGVRITDTSAFSNNCVQKLKQLNDYRIDAYLRLFDSLDSEIKKVSKEIQSRAEKEDVTKLLVTIPGIGYYSALLILSEIGDISRFPDSYHLCSYAGLVPTTHSSGGITYHGAITKTGSKHLRWIMIECVYTHIHISKMNCARRKGAYLLPSTASVAVLCVVGSIIITIFLGGINTLFASSSSQMPGMMGQHMDMENMSTMMEEQMGMVGQHMDMQNMTNQMPGMMGQHMDMQNMMAMMGKQMTGIEKMMTLMAKHMGMKNITTIQGRPVSVHQAYAQSRIVSIVKGASNPSFTESYNPSTIFQAIWFADLA